MSKRRALARNVSLGFGVTLLATLVAFTASAQATSLSKLTGTPSRITLYDTGCISVSSLESYWQILSGDQYAHNSIVLLKTHKCYVFTSPAVGKTSYMTSKGFALEKIIAGQYTGKSLYFNPISEMLLHKKDFNALKAMGIAKNPEAFYSFYRNAVVMPYTKKEPHLG